MEPATVVETLACQHGQGKMVGCMQWRKKWNLSMEMIVWDLIQLPKDRKAVSSKWAFKPKVGVDGSVERHKTQLVAQEFSQKFGADYDEIFSPVFRLESLQTVIALAVQNGMKLHQVHVDVTTAFLNGELEEEVYMKQLKGFIAKLIPKSRWFVS